MGSATTTRRSSSHTDDPVLPSIIADALLTLQWPQSPTALQLKPLAELDPPVLPLVGEIDVLDLVASLSMASTNTTQQKEHWAWIATALLLLGHGYVDCAHNLVGPLSFYESLPYFHGLPVATEGAVLAAASHVHALVHRAEGSFVGEFAQVGFANSHFWAGAALRSGGGEETLPLAQIRKRIEHLCLDHRQAQQWFQENYKNLMEEWDPRPLTELCEQVAQQGRHHGLADLAEQACLAELQILLQHALTQLGFSSTTLSSLPSLVERTTPTPLKIPRSLQEARHDFGDKAVVVTTASSPYRIVYVNTEWELLCGYTQQQAQGKTFSSFGMHGPDSNVVMARTISQQCREYQRPQHMYMVNYTASGERFINHITMAPMNNDNKEYLVAILQKARRRDGTAPAA